MYVCVYVRMIASAGVAARKEGEGEPLSCQTDAEHRTDRTCLCV